MARARKKSAVASAPRPPSVDMVMAQWKRGLLWIPEATRRLGMGTMAIYMGYRRGRIKGERAGGRIWVDVASVAERYGKAYCAARNLSARPW